MTSRRGHGEGSIYRRESDGKWCCSVNLGYGADGKRKQKVLYGRTRKEVAEKLKALVHEQQAGHPIATGRLTVADFLTRWLAEVVRPNKAPKTYRSYEQNVRLYLIPALGRHQLRQLEPRQVQALLNARRAAGMSVDSVTRMRDVLRNALNTAIVWRILTINVATMVTVPTEDYREKRALDPAQARRFLAAARGHRLEALFTVALSLGMRQGEILGLTWEAIEEERRILHVRTNLQRVDGAFELRRPKSAQSRRVVHLPPVLARALRAHHARQEAERQAAGDPAWNALGLVFCTANGRPYDGPNVTRYAQRLLTRAGLPRLTFHELRHSCASLLAAQGIPAHEIARLLGHADARLTMNLYTHGYDEGRRRVAETMDELLGGSEGEPPDESASN